MDKDINKVSEHDVESVLWPVFGEWGDGDDIESALENIAADAGWQESQPDATGDEGDGQPADPDQWEPVSWEPQPDGSEEGEDWEEGQEGDDQPEWDADPKEDKENENAEFLERLFGSDDTSDQDIEDAKAKSDELWDKADKETDPEKKQDLLDLSEKYDTIVQDLEKIKFEKEELATKYNTLESRYADEVNNRIIRDADAQDSQIILDTISGNPILKSITSYATLADTDDSAKAKLSTALKNYLKELEGVDVDELMSNQTRSQASALDPMPQWGIYGSQPEAQEGDIPWSIESVLGV